MANLKALRAAGLLDGGNHRQRARKFGVSYEYINPLTVYTRDEWTCRLCHQPIDPHATFPHPHSASLDHAVPISRGGPHTYDNVQAAHLRCNIRKAAIMPEPTEEPSTEGDTETRHDHRRTRLAKPTPRTVEASGHHGTSHRRG